MAATWKVRRYLFRSLSAFVALLVGLLALPTYAIMRVVLMIGGMASLLRAIAAVLRSPSRWSWSWSDEERFRNVD
jgi:hypothetical protein